MHLINSRHNSGTGSALVEFSITLPLFLAVVFVLIDISTMLIQKKQIEFAAKNALRRSLIEASDCTARAHDLFLEELREIDVSLKPIAGAEPDCEYYSSTARDDSYYASSILPRVVQRLHMKVNATANCYICSLTFGLADRFQIFSKTYNQILPEGHSCYDSGITEISACTTGG
jgi:hypothetical protein